jgi:phage terminase large subunit-like protein
MIDEIKLNTKDVEWTAGNMSKSEKTISFMNRYFIFRKERNVNTEGMFKVLEKTDKERDDIIQMRIDDSNETDV